MAQFEYKIATSVCPTCKRAYTRGVLKGDPDYDSPVKELPCINCGGVRPGQAPVLGDFKVAHVTCPRCLRDWTRSVFPHERDYGVPESVVICRDCQAV